MVVSRASSFSSSTASHPSTTLTCITSLPSPNDNYFHPLPKWGGLPGSPRSNSPRSSAGGGGPPQHVRRPSLGTNTAGSSTNCSARRPSIGSIGLPPKDIFMSASVNTGPAGHPPRPHSAPSSPSSRSSNSNPNKSNKKMQNTNNSNDKSSGPSSNTRVWVQQSALEKAMTSANPHSSSSTSSSIANKRHHVRNNSIGGLGPAAGGRPFALERSNSFSSSAHPVPHHPISSFHGSFSGGLNLPMLNHANSHGGYMSDSESCNGDGDSTVAASVHRGLKWGWKAGELVEEATSSGTCLRVRVFSTDDATEDTLGTEADDFMSAMRSLKKQKQQQHLPQEIHGGGTTSQIFTLPASALQSGDLVLANEYSVSEKDGELIVPDDLITLTHLHEPAVVESLQLRFERDIIYTSTGPVLLALNPFCSVRGMYGETIMKKYWDRAERNLPEKDCPPHVYAIADTSFRSMMRALEWTRATNGNSSATNTTSSATASATGSSAAEAAAAAAKAKDTCKVCNQSILVSGESGAGKTVTVKFVMKYLAALSQRSVALQAPAERAYKLAASGGCGDRNGLDGGTSQAMKKLKHGIPSPRRMSPSKSKAFQQPSWGTPSKTRTSLPTASSAASALSGKNRVSVGGVGSTTAATSAKVNHKTLSRSGSSMSNNGGIENSNSFGCGSSTGTDTLASATLLGGSCNSTIEAQVLQSNPILESFGNARTVRNDNSSRFGKFIEIQFTSTGKLVGAQIDTYLLEKVRLVTQSPGERNYHVFYEILSGAMDAKEMNSYFLAKTATAQDFNITTSGTYDRRDGVSDQETYRSLRAAMDTMRFTPLEVKQVFSIATSILHASNLNFVELPGEQCELDVRNVHLRPVCHLLGVAPADLNEALCSFHIQAGKNFIKRSLDIQKAERGLEALLKVTYAALFSYLVRRINESINYRSNEIDDDSNDARDALVALDGNTSALTPRAKSDMKSHLRPTAFIGVLDIFGFESFTRNSFEQLCINYCNEALQQQFNAFVLKNEQEEYEREGIEWSFIEFPENHDVLELIENRGSGILSILDDQCRAPGPSDKAFALDVYKKCMGQSRFQASRKQTATLQFSVLHYAGPVEYTAEGFTEKNRDELPKEATELLRSSSVEFVRLLADIIEHSHDVPSESKGGLSKAPPASVTPAKLHRADSSVGRATVGGQFRKQLRVLRHKIDTTAPHYVRCLKPNDMLVPEYFDAGVVAAQLRCGGILEAVRVARAGFTQHYPHVDFLRRYRALAWKELGSSSNSCSSASARSSSPVVTPTQSSRWQNPTANGYRNSFGGHNLNALRPTPRQEMSSADAQAQCKELVKILFKKIQRQEKGDDAEPFPETPKAEVVKAKSYSYQPTPPSWSKAAKKPPTAPVPSLSLPPLTAQGGSGSVKSRYTPWAKKAEESKNQVSTPLPPQPTTTTSTATTPWKRSNAAASTTDYLKVGLQMGKSKVFLRHDAFEVLEQMRSKEQMNAASKLNSIFRMYLARLAYLPYREAFRREIHERRQAFERGEEYKESKEADPMDFYNHKSRLKPTAAFHNHMGGEYACASLVDKWTESKVRDAIHNPIPRHEWGKQAPSRCGDFKWVLQEGIWVKNYQD